MKRKSESLKHFEECEAIADDGIGGAFIELRSDDAVAENTRGRTFNRV